MSKNAMTTIFLKECMADSLLKLMKEKDISKITIDEIAAGAGVNRSTWFRNFDTKNEALTFKLVQIWNRWADEHNVIERNKFTVKNSHDFFSFNYENRKILDTLYHAGLDTVIYEAFIEIMMPRFVVDPKECYEARFYSFGLYGLLEEWIKRDYAESPREMANMFIKFCIEPFS